MNDMLMVKLAEQADEGFQLAMVPAEIVQKFVKLIVQECATVARNTDLEDVEGGDSAVLRAASDQIKSHFGV
jgi:hypothetical protein